MEADQQQPLQISSSKSFHIKKMTKNIDHMEQQEEEKIPETHLS